VKKLMIVSTGQEDCRVGLIKSLYESQGWQVCVDESFGDDKLLYKGQEFSTVWVDEGVILKDGRGTTASLPDSRNKALKNHLGVLKYLSDDGCFKIQQPDTPEKIKKPKHKPPFWANNWGNK
jgi:hypothetical protein